VIERLIVITSQVCAIGNSSLATLVMQQHDGQAIRTTILSLPNNITLVSIDCLISLSSFNIRV